MPAFKLDDSTEECFYRLWSMLTEAANDHLLDGMPRAEVDAWYTQRVALLDAMHPGFAAYLDNDCIPS